MAVSGKEQMAPCFLFSTTSSQASEGSLSPLPSTVPQEGLGLEPIAAIPSRESGVSYPIFIFSGQGAILFRYGVQECFHKCLSIVGQAWLHL